MKSKNKEVLLLSASCITFAQVELILQIGSESNYIRTIVLFQGLRVLDASCISLGIFLAIRY